jgi:hypothetical protein
MANICNNENLKKDDDNSYIYQFIYSSMNKNDLNKW